MIKSLGILREAKTDNKGREVESRVILTPPLVKKLLELCPGLTVTVETNAGVKIDFSDADYKAAGAVIGSHNDVLAQEFIVAVKETRNGDFAKLDNNIWLSYQHFAQSKERTEKALAVSKRRGTTFFCLETMENDNYFSCLAPMSEAAAKIIARHADEYALLAKKVITSGMPETGLHGVKTTILGGGSVGRTAAEEFSQRGCEVYLLEKNPAKIKSLTEYFKAHEIRFPKVTVLELSPENLRNTIRDSFFLISAMYNSGKKPEKLITIDLLKTLTPGGCIYPIDIDQGGGVEGVIETSILEPFDLPTIPGTEIFFFAPTNLPSMGARTTSEALGTTVLPYLAEIINKGLDQAATDNPIIKTGINIRNGEIVHPGLASVFPGL
jgi:alanine dehydrogenase